MRPAAPVRAALQEKGFWALTLVGIAFFYRPLLLGETFFFRDLYAFYLPQESRFVDFLRSGEAPFWDPFLHGGMPFLADISASTLYPLNVLGFLLSPTAALSFGIVGHFLAAAGAAYVLARVLGAGPPAAFVAGAVYGYCGFTLSQGNFLHRIQATPYVPLLLLFWHLFVTEGRRRWFLLAVACGALQVLAGSPTVIAPCLLTALGWGLCLASGDRRSLFRGCVRWAALSAGIAGLTALQLLPTAELAGQSSRGEGMSYASFSFWSLHPLRLPELVLPGYLGAADTLSEGSFWGTRLVDRGFPYFVSLYTGGIAAVLALLGASGHRLPHRRLRFYLLALVAFSALLALGRHLPFFEILYDVVPGIGVFRFPVKFLAFGVLPLALLAAFGAEAALSDQKDDSKRARRTLLAAWVVLGVPTAALLVATRVPAWSATWQEALLLDPGPPAAEGLSAAAGHALGISLLATMIAFLPSRLGLPVRRWSLAAVVAADLLLAGRSVNPTAAPEVIDAAPAAARLVADTVGDGRLYRGARPERFSLDTPTDDVVWLYRWNQEVLQFFIGASYGIPMIFHDDFNGFEPRRTLLLSQAVGELPWHQRWPLLAAASVRVVMTHDELAREGLERIGTVQNASRVPVHVYRDERAARRLEWIGVWHTVDSERAALRAMLSSGFDPRRHAVLEAPIAPRASAGCEAPARVELTDARPSRRAYSVTAPCDGVLVFSETFYPGCEVWIDGRRVPTWRANVAFTAAALAAGEHEVVWRYVPRSFYGGLAVSVVTLVALALVLRNTLKTTVVSRAVTAEPDS